jgi:RNA polymerase subunit RPABC4/transcription elongation factor Spt4
MLSASLNSGVAGLAAVFFLILGLYAIVMWMALAYWALKDARERAESASFHLFALFVNLLLPVLGLFVYMLVRPSTTLADQRAIAIEEEVLAGPPLESTTRPCPACAREIERDFVLCPYCHTRFAKRCPSCSHAVRLGWTLCPYCATSLELGTVSRAAGQI